MHASCIANVLDEILAGKIPRTVEPPWRWGSVSRPGGPGSIPTQIEVYQSSFSNQLIDFVDKNLADKCYVNTSISSRVSILFTASAIFGIPSFGPADGFSRNRGHVMLSH